jgi:hypothetical protein
MNHIAELLKKIPSGANVLELGCGAGESVQPNSLAVLTRILIDEVSHAHKYLSSMA